MKNYSYSGQSIPFTAAEDLTSGQPYLLGSAFGIVSNSLLKGHSGELFVTGVWHLEKPKKEFKNGQRIYWDVPNKVIAGGVEVETAPQPSNYKLIGMAVEDAGVDQNTFLCRLNGVTV